MIGDMMEISFVNAIFCLIGDEDICTHFIYVNMLMEKDDLIKSLMIMR